MSTRNSPRYKPPFTDYHLISRASLGESQIAKKALLDHPVPEYMWPELHAIKDNHSLEPLIVREQGHNVPVLDYEAAIMGSLVRLEFHITLRDDRGVEASVTEIEVLYRDVV